MEQDIQHATGTRNTAAFPRVRPANLLAPRGPRRVLPDWLTAWEIYPILLVATFLRFYQLGLTEFDTDQAVLWNLPYMAVKHGLIPTNGNLSSIGLANPPGFTWFLMLPAVLTANPLAGAALIAFLNVLGVLFTYIFTRRYHGRLAAGVAAALTATSLSLTLYSRFIWQPNLLLPILPLYLLVLYRGAIERGTGWFAPALFLLALAQQVSGSSVYLLPMLVLAYLLAPRTVRVRDWLLGALLFALPFSTYLVWEAATRFTDGPVLLHRILQHASLDSQAVSYYLHLLQLYSGRPIDPQLLSARIFPLLYLHWLTILLLVCAGFVLLALGLFWKRVDLQARNLLGQRVVETPPLGAFTRARATFWSRLRAGWRVLTDTPQKRAILLLLTWQLVPLVLTLRHSIALQAHYFLILMPGPYILVGLLVSQFARWGAPLFAAYKQERVLNLLVPILAILLILAQTVGTLAWLLDSTGGRQAISTEYNSLSDLQNAVQAADQLALSHHLQHVYIDIDTDTRTSDSFAYLAGQMRTPHTVLTNNSSHCLLLPNARQGLAVMLFGPTSAFDEALLRHSVTATLVSRPARLGSAPFHLYIVQPLVSSPASTPRPVGGALAFAEAQPVSLTWLIPNTATRASGQLLVTLWENQARRPGADSSWWTYHFAATSAGGAYGIADCQPTALQPGEQLLVPFAASPGATTPPTALAITGTIAVNTPDVLSYGPLRFQTLREQTTTLATFAVQAG